MKDYIDALIQVKDSRLPTQEKLKLLDELYKIKPVRLQWYAVKADILLREMEDGAAAAKLLKDKFVSFYEYEGVLSSLELLTKLDNRKNDKIMSAFRGYSMAQLEGNAAIIDKEENKLKWDEEQFLQEPEKVSAWRLAQSYFVCGKWLTYYVLRLYESFQKKRNLLKRPWIAELQNMGYLREGLEQKKKIFIFVSGSADKKEAYILGKCMAEMGCPVWVISEPMIIEVDALINIKDTLAVSQENAENICGFTLIPSIEVIYNGKSIGNNHAEIINKLCGTEENVLIFADSRKFEELSCHPLLHNRIENLSGYQEGFRTFHYILGQAGSYLKYIGQLYQMDTEKAVYRKPTCRFSIVIPVRNSATTLQHTLHTCLNQRYQGEYEIIISDNSSEENSEVWSFCQTLQDKRIKYFRTPRNLNLSRSFEYAFLQANGEYIFSIGADDAVLPWTLEVLDQIAGQYPEEEILYWDRGFYAWPGFNKGQENQFCIPQNYQKGNYQASLKEPVRYLSAAMENTDRMYLLPMLYINSCFKRTFFQTLLKETGRMWDGICQDLYMGTVISVIKEKIVYINYPLAIAGMSENSIGAISTLPMENQEKGAAYMNRTVKEGNIGGFSKSRTEALMPELGSDVTSLYNSILRAVNRGLMPAHYLTDVFDWKQWFLNSYRVLSKKDIYFDRKIHQMRYAAMKHGEAFLKWFDDNIYKEALTPVIYEEEEKPEKIKKTYQEINDGSQIVLDASKYDVHNIYEASLLFERLTGL